METQQLESLVINVVDAALAGRQAEDDRVELKTVWPKAEHKTARQIAGHANASGGEPILWIIGFDEKSRQFGETSGVEPANWWNSVRRHFVEVAPDLKILRVSVAGGHDVLALQFSSDRAPYVVGVEGGGQVEREVPWREGNSTRTAHRHEMIRSIVAEASVPTLELVGGLLEIEECVGSDDVYGHRDDAKIGDFRVRCALDMFLSATAPSYLPEHRQTLTAQTLGSGLMDLSPFRLKGSYRFDGIAASGMRRQVPFGNVSILGESGVEVKGPGELGLRVERVLGPGQGAAILDGDEVELVLGLPVDKSDRTSRLTCLLSSASNTTFSERDIPDIHDAWHLRKRFTIKATPRWWA